MHLFRKIAVRPVGHSSLLRAIAALLPIEVLWKVIRISPDRRYWSVTAAAWIGVTEEEFMVHAARGMGLEFRNQLDLSLIGHTDGVSSDLIELYKKRAAVPILSNGEQVWACLDPSLLRGIPGFSNIHKTIISTSDQIANALRAFDLKLASEAELSNKEKVKSGLNSAAQVVGFILSEARKYKAEYLDVIQDESEVRYLFVTPEGKRGAGRIHPEVAPYLSQLADRQLSGEEKQGNSVKWSKLSDSHIRLTWSDSIQNSAGDQSQANASSPGEYRHSTDTQALAIPVEASAEIPKSEPVTEKQRAISDILIIDDNRMFVRILRQFLERKGWSINASFSGEEAFAFMERCDSEGLTTPRLIICDLHMPIRGGREVLAGAKAREKWRDIPFLMLTSDDDGELEAQLLEMGAEACVPKSKDPRVLCAYVERLLNSKKREAA